MRPSKKYIVVEATEDGGVEIQKMKEWCRAHPDESPPMDPNQTNSHALRRGFKELGWVIEETDSQVRFFRPGTAAVVSDTLGGDDGEPLDVDDERDSHDTVFELEFQLRDFIAHNIETININGRRCRLYVDPTGRDGIEYPTGVGFIDILAIDADGAFVVFELKRGRVPDQAIGQIARYMGWLKKTIARDRPVRGVIVAKSISDNLRFAIAAVPNVSLFEYEVSFTLHLVDEASESSTVA
ncbi:DUF91 domain-containing protein [Alcaligenaceae bacterium CGII-47]|nr:DUF91 domain-containing protein [Alcaligenaceae bacterium CGII-47]